MLDPCSSDPSKSAFPSRLGRPIVVAVALVAVAVAVALAVAAAVLLLQMALNFQKGDASFAPFARSFVAVAVVVDDIRS